MMLERPLIATLLIAVKLVLRLHIAESTATECRAFQPCIGLCQLRTKQYLAVKRLNQSALHRVNWMLQPTVANN